jgi:hypothetical protein
MQRALGAYERRGPDGTSNSSQVRQANASAAALSALEIHVCLVGHKFVEKLLTSAMVALLCSRVPLCQAK